MHIIYTHIQHTCLYISSVLLAHVGTWVDSGWDCKTANSEFQYISFLSITQAVVAQVYAAFDISSAGWGGLDSDVANLGASSLTCALVPGIWCWLFIKHRGANWHFRVAHRELSTWTHHEDMWRHSKAVVRQYELRFQWGMVPLTSTDAGLCRMRCWHH